MAQRGRPRGGDSAETRRRIIRAARDEFAARGFDGASVATVAAKSELAPSAVYHYFGGKSALYEEVFDACTEAVWSDIHGAATQADTLVHNVETLVKFIRALNPEQRSACDFLALVPTETALHPEFSHVVEQRVKWQDATFGALAEIGLKTGELHGFTVEVATDMLRSLLMGWFYETYFQSSTNIHTGECVLTTIRVLAGRFPAEV